MSTSSINVKPRIVRTHLALYVKDPEASARWYEDVLDMEVTAREPRWVFLSFGKKHHDIALIKADPAQLRAQQIGDINMQHYGLEIDGAWLVNAGLPMPRVQAETAFIVQLSRT